MKTKIYCKTTAKDTQSFYLEHEGETHFLFSQEYRKSVKAYYGTGVSLNEALNNPRGGKDHALRKTMEKLPSYIKYIEKEYGFAVLEQTIRKEERKHSHKRARRAECDKWYDDAA
jgi:hypothetical protein